MHDLASGAMSLRSVANGALGRARTLPGRHGGPVVLALLCLVLALALGLRLEAALTPNANPGADSVVAYQGNDSLAYGQIAETLYRDHRYGTPAMDHPTDWSPGAPLLYAGVYYLTGGVHPDAARSAVAFLGLLMVLFVYLIGRRLGGPVVGLVAAGLAAVYPTFIDNNGQFVSEPIAAFTLAGCVLGFMWASDRARSAWAWIVPGLFLGATALTRPEYLLFAFLLGILVLARTWRGRGIRIGIASAALFVVAFGLVLAPWTIRNVIVLDRFVPVTTGGGKALFVATYLPGDGRQIRVKRHLIEIYTGNHNVTDQQVAKTQMSDLLNGVAKKYPKLERDAALARIGRENFRKYATEQPGAYARMVATKMWNVWRRGSGPTMRASGWVVFHYALLALALVGLAVLALRRRWEALLLAVLIGGITVLGGVLLAVPRRNVPLIPLVCVLAAGGAYWLVVSARGRLAERWRRGGRVRLRRRQSQAA
jgi:4-amino-4-deoxy-L-arabinose transferase-like glycosyltransferase